MFNGRFVVGWLGLLVLTGYVQSAIPLGQLGRASSKGERFSWNWLILIRFSKHVIIEHQFHQLLTENSVFNRPTSIPGCESCVCPSGQTSVPTKRRETACSIGFSETELPVLRASSWEVWLFSGENILFPMSFGVLRNGSRTCVAYLAGAELELEFGRPTQSTLKCLFDIF